MRGRWPAVLLAATAAEEQRWDWHWCAGRRWVQRHGWCAGGHLELKVVIEGEWNLGPVTTSMSSILSRTVCCRMPLCGRACPTEGEGEWSGAGRYKAPR